MSSLSRELVFLILQFLDEEKFRETVHKLEQESGFYFNVKYFEEQILAGNWEEVESYLSGFTKVDDNRYSMKIFFEIRKQKYLEALDKGDRTKAADYLVKDLKVFSSFNDELYKELTHLITLDNFRDNEQLSRYGDTRSARNIMLGELKKLIDANPMFRDKLQFPALRASRLRTLINQSLNWQHQLCKVPKQNPDIKTLFTDHTCGSSHQGQQVKGFNPPTQTTSLMQGLAQQRPPQTQNHYGLNLQTQVNLGLGVGPHGYGPHPSHNNAIGWMQGNQSPPPQTQIPHHLTNPNLTLGPSLQSNLQQLPPNSHQANNMHPGNVPGLALQQVHQQKPNRPMNLNPSFLEFQQVVPSEPQRMPRPLHPPQLQEELMKHDDKPILQSMVPVPPPGPMEPDFSVEDIPKTPYRVLKQGSCVMSMDFHKTQNTLLLVGTEKGDVAIWEAGFSEKLWEEPFFVWKAIPGANSQLPGVSVNRVIWEPNGDKFGVAFSRHYIHIYNYDNRHKITKVLELDAHTGGVNDVAFAKPHNPQLCVLTCGDDKLIKVWDATAGKLLFTFEGHDVPVYSLCPHQKENIQFFFSTAIDGRIKAWLYDQGGSKVDYDAPGRWCTTMAYSADGSRLFSCGTSKEGESSLVEWNETEGSIKRSYLGFRKRSLGVVQFDTTRNKFLAAGDEHMIKFWDMNNTNMLLTLDAGGNLPASPRLRFNNDGSLLAVTSGEDYIKILANDQGKLLLDEMKKIGESQKPLPIQAMVPKPKPISPVNPPAVLPAQPPPVVVQPIPQAVSPPGQASPQPSPPEVIQVQPTEPQTQGTTAQVQPPPVERRPSPPPLPPVATAAQTIAAEVSRLDIPFRNSEPQVFEISEPSQLKTAVLHNPEPANKITRLLYTNSSSSILALGSNAVHKLWKWQKSERNPSGKANLNVSPLLWQPQTGLMMVNEVGEGGSEEAFHCIALSKNDSYVMSASGGKVSLFNMLTFKVMTTFMSPPPTATVLAFHPQDNNIIAVGMKDSTIKIYNVRLDEIKCSLRGHQKRITSLAFSSVLNILVSAGADSQLVVWASNTSGDNEWEKKRYRNLGGAYSKSPPPQVEVKIQFLQDQKRLLVGTEAFMAIYHMGTMERLKQWAPRESSSPTSSITSGTLSGDSSLVYVGFSDGSIMVFDVENLRPTCKILPSAYLTLASNSPPPCPVDIAGNPQEAKQFAVGLSNGTVQLLEPVDGEVKWGKISAGEKTNTKDASAGGANGPTEGKN